MGIPERGQGAVVAPRSIEKILFKPKKNYINVRYVTKIKIICFSSK
jgi:hypothetical protein